MTKRASEKVRVGPQEVETLQFAARLVCDYCGARAFGSVTGEVPFQFQDDGNWYHRETSPCKAAAIHEYLKKSQLI